MNEWNNFVEKLKSLPKTQVRDITRFFCGNAIKVIPDGQGRVMLNRELIDFAGITDSITFIGCGDRVEMWRSDRNPLGGLDENFLSQISDTMIDLGI